MDASNPTQATLLEPLASYRRRDPVTCAPAMALGDALQRMREARVSLMVACDAAVKPLGVFSLHDLLDAAADGELDLARPIGALLQPVRVQLDGDTPAWQALLAMARENVRHALVTRGGRLDCVVAESDLLSLQQVGVRMLAGRVRDAANVQALDAAEREVHVFEHSLRQHPLGVEQTRAIGELFAELIDARRAALDAAGAPARRPARRPR